MSEPAKPKRPWFRFHLSTAVLLTLTAGGMVWPNVIPNPRYQYVHYTYRAMYSRYYGWPVAFAWSHNRAVIDEERKISRGELYPMKLSWIPGLLIDGAFFVGVLGLVAFLSESIIRHREARKP